MKHLRYIFFMANTKIKILPKSIFKLQNLQVLVVGEEGSEELPKDERYVISLRYLVIIAEQKRLPEGGIGCSKFLRTLLIYECENLQKMLSLLFHFFKRLLLLWCRLNSVWVDVFLNKKNFFKKHFGLLSKCFFLNALNNKLSKPPIFQTIKIFISPLILIFYFFIKLFDIILYLIFIK